MNFLLDEAEVLSQQYNGSFFREKLSHMFHQVRTYFSAKKIFLQKELMRASQFIPASFQSVSKRKPEVSKPE